MEAVQASAVNDLGCPPAALELKDVSPDIVSVYEFVVDGCGWSATYRVVPVAGISTAAVVQISRFPSVLPPRQPSP
jgi:hypothetical protein